ncbi:hypothetical protein [Psychrobacter sp. GW64-MNA-CIBAN-0177]|uniref:hypothetical protein n=1 Tax=Psychrobacter sp. GW64-MNA-CIBAN-0177 TaxID=3140449 RepID=UPI00332E4BDA
MAYWKIGGLIVMVGINAYLFIATSAVCDSQNIAMYVMAVSLQLATMLIIFKPKIYTQIITLLRIRKALFILPILMVFASFYFTWEAKRGTYIVGGQQYCIEHLAEGS